MKIIRDISEDEMIASFLKGEIESTRFGNQIKEQLVKDNRDIDIIRNPNISDEKENEYRKNLLGGVRGYGRNTDLFEDFPEKVTWKKVLLNKEDLNKAKYINYDYWVELTNGSRYPRDATKQILNGVEIFGVSNDKFINAAKYIQEGGNFPEMIFVCKETEKELIILEGHLRMTAYFLNPKNIPDEIEAFLGISDEFGKWGLF